MFPRTVSIQNKDYATQKDQKTLILLTLSQKPQIVLDELTSANKINVFEGCHSDRRHVDRLYNRILGCHIQFVSRSKLLQAGRFPRLRSVSCGNICRSVLSTSSVMSSAYISGSGSWKYTTKTQSITDIFYKMTVYVIRSQLFPVSWVWISQETWMLVRAFLCCVFLYRKTIYVHGVIPKIERSFRNMAEMFSKKPNARGRLQRELQRTYLLSRTEEHPRRDDAVNYRQV